jgi:hypothetical protein
MARPVTDRQLKMLLTLWKRFCRHSNLDPKDRVARLDWASGVIGRQIASFRELRAYEANAAILVILKHLPPELVRKRASRWLAHAYGTAGRQGRAEKEVRLANAETIRLVDMLLRQLGWTRERLDAFLRSSRSPVRSGKIRTLAEANRVIWSLKGMARREESSDGTALKRAG